MPYTIPGEDARRAEAALDEALSIVSSIEDDMERLRASSYIAKKVKLLGINMADVRASTMRSLNAQGMTYEQLAIQSGVTKGRIQQILGKVDRGSNKPGAVEQKFALRAAELRAQNFSGDQIAAILLPEIRRTPGGQGMPAHKISNILAVDEEYIEIYDPDAQ